MSRGDPLLRSLDKLWKEFSSASKKALAKASEKQVHHLRVTTRRLMAAIDLIPDLSGSEKIADARRRFKKVLNWTSPLRDIHVQLEKASHIPKVDLRKFQRRLEEQEDQEIAGIQKHLKRLGAPRLAQQVKVLREELIQVHKNLNQKALHREITRNLESRSDNFHASRKKFRPADEDTLHDMRIALKKLRYAAEAAQPLFGDSVIQHAQKMKSFQQLVGDARDAAILRSELEQWAAKRGKQKAIVRALDQLHRQREALLAQIIKILPSLEKLTVVPSKRRPQHRRSTPHAAGKQGKNPGVGEKTLVMSSNTTPSVGELSLKQKAG